MTPGRVAILGMGLMGGSLGLALRALRDPPRVCGFDVSPDVARRARERGAADAISADPGEAIGDAEAVFLAVPPRAALDLLALLETRLGPGAVFADLSSVMLPFSARVEQQPALRGRGVSSHPLCGSERNGIEAARGDLYRDHVVLIAAARDGGRAAERVSSLWRAVGAVTRPIEPATHDALLALTSHLPLLASAALARALRASGRGPEVLRAAAGPGLRDATRLAGSPAGLWEEILSLNRDRIGPALSELEAEIAELRRALEGDAPRLRALLEEARTFREVLLP